MMDIEHNIINFYSRAKKIIDDTYGSDTDCPYDDSYDNLEKAFGNDHQTVVLLQYEYDDYEPMELPAIVWTLVLDIKS